jgi:hypothetical protein
MRSRSSLTAGIARRAHRSHGASLSAAAAGTCAGYASVIEIGRSRGGPKRTALQVARAVAAGRGISEALRHLDAHGSGPDGVIVADALARFLVARCESRHAGWRVVRQVVVDSAAAGHSQRRTRCRPAAPDSDRPAPLPPLAQMRAVGPARCSSSSVAIAALPLWRVRTAGWR